MREIRVRIYLPEWIFRLRIWSILLYRRLKYGYAFRKIPLTQDKYAIVDPERYEELSKYKWFAIRSERGYYALRMTKAKRGSRVRQKAVRMHRVVLGAPENRFIDHINHNGLDNRIANLRLCTMQQNMWNKRKQRGNYSSQYKGVNWNKNVKKWVARISCNGKTISLGYFYDEIEAAKAYDAKAKKLFGEYAAPNLPSAQK